MNMHSSIFTQYLTSPLLLSLPLHSLKSSKNFTKLHILFKMHLISTLVVAATVASTVLAHPGHDTSHEQQVRSAFLKNTNRRDLSECSEQMRKRGFEAQATQRRAAKANAAREKRGIVKRDVPTLLNTTHASSESYTPSTDEATIFSGNNSCILSPEVTQGPYCKSRSHNVNTSC